MSSILEVYGWRGEGYQPLVFSHDWQVALLNWEPVFDLPNLGEVERHNHSDEVFVLWRGRGALFIASDEGIKVMDMEPGVIYNVTRGAWHNLVATRDISWIIVETRDTHLRDTQMRQMIDAELEQLRMQLPAWVERR